MKTIENTSYEGERPLYKSRDLKISNVVIYPGESALKECANIEADHCEFQGKYPFWCIDKAVVRNSTFCEGARAAIWYCHNFEMYDCVNEAPKTLREIDGLTLVNVKIPNAVETMWHCSNIKVEHVEVDKAEYCFLHSHDIRISDYKHVGGYSFQYCLNVEIRNADIHSKDAFWNTENVTVYDSVLNGEYLGWYSKRLRLVNCTISGTQPLCYASDLVLENCKFAENADLAFEYSTVNATISGKITSVKNPTSGHIVAQVIGELILDENIEAHANCVIEQTNK